MSQAKGVARLGRPSATPPGVALLTRRSDWLIVLTVALVVAVGFMPFAVVRNARGRQYIGLIALGDAAVQGFWNTRNEQRLRLGVVPNGNPTISLLGRNELPRLGLWVDEDDRPSLMLYNPGVAGGITIDLRKDGSPAIVMKPPTGKGVIFMGFLEDGNPVVYLVDKHGNLFFQTPVADDPRELPEPSGEQEE